MALPLAVDRDHDRAAMLRIPTIPAVYSDLKPAIIPR